MAVETQMETQVNPPVEKPWAKERVTKLSERIIDMRLVESFLWNQLNSVRQDIRESTAELSDLLGATPTPREPIDVTLDKGGDLDVR